MKVALLDDFHPLIQQSFSDWKWEVINAKKWSIDDLKKNAPHLNGLVIRSKFPLNQNILKLAKNLKFIARPGSGLENIDLEYCKRNNIEVFRSPEGNCDALAEHTTGMLLSLIHRIPKANTEVKNGGWKREENRGSELKGKTIGLIGYGYMGKAFAKRLSSFNIDIIAYDKYKSGFETPFVKEVTLNEIFEKSNFVSLHTPLTNETIGMVNTSFIEKFKNPFILINTARGQSVVIKDLIHSLKTKKIKGACLDVLELENKDFSIDTSKNKLFEELIKFENVILTPHIAGWTHESKEEMGRVIIKKIQQKFFQIKCI